ncbi:2-aminoethanethiol dioxygenase-like [Diadema antillarum]|uniref:2-aminoethanethiol dioxygenase-like n=1 Tax=Diadema antillarum TaxID=105358 RepID=UPI003A8566B2
MAAIQKLAKQAWDVFRVAFRDRSALSDNLKSIQDAMTKIRASDLCFESEQQGSSESGSSPAPARGTIEGLSQSAAAGAGDAAPSAPVGYMHLFEDGVMTMGVFILREGSRIPLHNHPGMHGLLKVLYGKIKVRTFNVITDDWTNMTIPKFEGFPENVQPKPHTLVPTLLGIDQEINASSETVLLTPRTGNYHSLEPVDGAAAFLDILSPPYDPVIGRDCYYFRELQNSQRSAQEAHLNSQGSDPNIQWLMQISQPYDFWCDEVEYAGPEVKLS